MWKTYSIILLCILVLILTGCDNTEYVYRDGHGTNPKTDVVEIVVSDNGIEYIVLCIDNVGYLHRREGYAGFMSPYYNKNGSLNTCGE